jgi:UDP-glucose:(heptosyl)LPS alpha-1,3-glucosyltransferase
MSDLHEQTPRRPRVVVVAHDVVCHGGMERAMYELILGARDRVDFTVVSVNLAEDLRPFVRWRRVPAIRRPFVVKFLMFFVLSGFRYRRRDVDLVHTLGAILPRRSDVMAVHFCHASYRSLTTGADLESDEAWLRRLNISVAFRVGLIAERVFSRPPWARVATAVSAGGARELARFYPDLLISVVPNGVDHTRFRPDSRARAQIRTQVGAQPAEVVALFVGGRWSQKGLEIAIRGLAHSQRRTAVPISLWVVGSGDPSRYQTIADELGVGDRLRFFGYLKETEQVYQGADIFVLPSAYETFCMVAYEAASSGLPVVATAVNGVDDLIGDGSAGVMVDATAPAVGDALRELADDVDLRSRMGAAGRRAVRDVTWTAAVDKSVALYEDLLGQHRTKVSR